MGLSQAFPSLDGFEPTRQTLQLYSRVVSAVMRAHAHSHPRWWHISLKVVPDGLATDDVPLPTGGLLTLKLDLRNHEIVLVDQSQVLRAFDMTLGTPASAMGEAVLSAVTELGLTGPFARDRFENNQARDYNPVQAQRFLDVLVHVDRIFKLHRASLPGEVGPVQLWPHGFDLAFEWFGSRVQSVEEHGQLQHVPAQLNLGFYPGDPASSPYFYSNPWPFESEFLLDKPLPAQAHWHTEGWQGTMLPYAALVDEPNAEEHLLEYARTVYELARPTLLEGWKQLD
jgi:hypothetical protein